MTAKEVYFVKLHQKVNKLSFLCSNNLVFSVLDVLAQLIMTWMLLFISLGWTLGSSVSHPLHDKKLFILIISVGVVEVSLHI